MTDSTGKAGAVLLPAAKVALHVSDRDTLEAARSLVNDWRFARVQISIHEGSIETATQFYAEQSSPELVIVETASIEDGFTNKLEALAGHCSGDTSAVIIGPVNDVYLYRKMIDMGVSDYLVKPVAKEVLAEVISKTLIEKFGASESLLIACIGAKGGVGASTIAQSTARISAEIFDQKTMILDAAGGWSYLSISMGTEPMTNFNEMVRLSQSSDEAAFKRMIFSPSEKLSVLATGADPMLDDSVSAENYEMLLSKLMTTYPVVVADLSGASSLVKKAVLSRAHKIILVSTPSLSSLRAARSLSQEIKTLRGGSTAQLSFVINKAGEAAGKEIGRSDIEKAMELKPEAIIEYAGDIFTLAESQGKKINEIKGSEKIYAALTDFTSAILSKKKTAKNDSKAEGLGLSGLLGKLTKKA